MSRLYTLSPDFASGRRARCYNRRTMADDSPHQQAWRAAREWFQAQPMGRRKVELTAIIRPIYDSLKQAPDAEALERLYVDPADAETALGIARNAYPGNERLWDPARTRDVAYGLRLAELEREAGRAPDPGE